MKGAPLKMQFAFRPRRSLASDFYISVASQEAEKFIEKECRARVGERRKSY